MTTNIGYKKGNLVNYFYNLSYNERREFFVRILWQKDKEPKHFNDELNNEEKEIDKIDHISFHEDGTIHITYFTAQGQTERLHHAKIKPINTMPPGCYAPLLILSVYNTEETFKHIGNPEPCIFKNQPNQNIDFDFQIQFEQFSLVFFVVGPEVNTTLMLQKFPGIFMTNYSPVILNFFGDPQKVELNSQGGVAKVNDLGLAIGFTTKVIPQPDTDLLMSSSKRANFSRVEHALGIRTAPSDASINSLK